MDVVVPTLYMYVIVCYQFLGSGSVPDSAVATMSSSAVDLLKVENGHGCIPISMLGCFTGVVLKSLTQRKPLVMITSATQGRHWLISRGVARTWESVRCARALTGEKTTEKE